jgi:hypothetical protein
VSDLKFIDEAFSARKRPEHVRDTTRPPDDIYADADAFAGMDWRDVTCAVLDKHYDAIYGFTPTAFCYFLPGIFSAGIRQSRPEMLVNQGLIMTLDRGNAPASWDEFFSARWPKLSPQECEATQRWILWLDEFDPPPIADAALSRAYDTMGLLAHQTGATPIAAWSRKPRP